MRKIFAAVLLLLAPAIAAAADATPRPNIVFAAGVIAPVHHGTANSTAATFDVSYRWGQQYWYVSPLVGAMITADGDGAVYAGGYHDFRLGARWTLTPFLTLAAYHNGGGNNLGGTFQFYWGADLMYRMDNDWRIGVTARHISNAGLPDNNPGTEVIMFLLSMPLR